LSEGFTSGHSTQNRSFWRRSSQPISWLSTEKLNYHNKSKHASVTKYTMTQNQSQVWSPLTTSGLETETGMFLRKQVSKWVSQ